MDDHVQDRFEVDLGDQFTDEEGQIDEYQLSSSPNDFNVVTIASFIESGAIRIPGFQRHYVWDIRRASKLIESIVIGLPIPQIFLYEEDQNSFLVIDGQQRLMSLYFFVKQRFPRKQWRSEMRRVFNSEGRIPDDLLANDAYFQNFNLSLAKLPNGKPNKFHGLNYATLGTYRNAFDLRTMRCVIVRQIKPSDDDSSIYEMFNRLNTGGMNLKPQEIRASIYHSDLFDLLFEQNMREEWRALVNSETPDIHMRDVEILLRAIAMYYDGDSYRPSMTSFLNKFCKRAKETGRPSAEEVEELFDQFFDAASLLSGELFRTKSGFSVMAFESVFRAALKQRISPGQKIDPQSVAALRADPEYREWTEVRTNDTSNVLGRLQRGEQLVRVR